MTHDLHHLCDTTLALKGGNRDQFETPADKIPLPESFIISLLFFMFCLVYLVLLLINHLQTQVVDIRLFLFASYYCSSRVIYN